MCNAGPKSQNELNTHYRNSHDKVKCYVCHQLFNTPSSLTRHLYWYEIPTKACRCGKVFCFNSELKSHKLKHRRIRTEHCPHPTCNKSYFSPNDLAKHVKTHSNKVWNCDKCTYSTKDKRLLKSHQRKHSQPVNYKCDCCAKAFVYHTQWKHHKTANNCVVLKCSDSPEL